MFNPKLILFFLCHLIINITYSQFKVTFVVKQSTAKHLDDTIFVAGNFNNWNPGNKEDALVEGKDGTVAITLSLPAGNYEYKFTRGEWTKAETDATGNGAPNRTLHGRYNYSGGDSCMV